MEGESSPLRWDRDDDAFPPEPLLCLLLFTAQLLRHSLFPHLPLPRPPQSDFCYSHSPRNKPPWGHQLPPGCSSEGCLPPPTSSLAFVDHGGHSFLPETSCFCDTTLSVFLLFSGNSSLLFFLHLLFIL